jgi:hypothetical protein
VTMMSAGSSLPSLGRMSDVVKAPISLVDGGAPAPDRIEEVAVGDEAKPRVPGIVVWREMRIDVVIGDHFANRSASAISFFCRLTLASHKPAASGARYGQSPGVGATNGATRRKPQCRPDSAKLLKERQDLATLQLAADQHLAPPASTPWI